VPIVIIGEEIIVKPRMLKQINIKDFLLIVWRGRMHDE